MAPPVVVGPHFCLYYIYIYFGVYCVWTNSSRIINSFLKFEVTFCVFCIFYHNLCDCNFFIKICMIVVCGLCVIWSARFSVYFLVRVSPRIPHILFLEIWYLPTHKLVQGGKKVVISKIFLYFYQSFFSALSFSTTWSHVLHKKS